MSVPKPLPLPPGIRQRFVEGVNDLTMHVLEAGYDTPGRPLLLLLHGFPELAFSWRKIMLPLAEAGYHVIAPDQRGYGLTTGWDASYDGDVSRFHMLAIVRDALTLVAKLGYKEVEAVIGHDFGSPAAAYAALIRPDVFKSVVLMSAPFGGPPGVPTSGVTVPNIHRDLASLKRPRKHYQWYYSTREANDDMLNAKDGLHNFLRAYFHHKSADWPENQPYRLKGWTADELAKMPTYYIMDQAQTMAETVAPHMPTTGAVDACTWMTEEEMAVYAAMFQKTGFQGGLQWYRCMTDPAHIATLQLFAGKTIDVPAMFIAGLQDWGIYQKPGDFERMQTDVCTNFQACHLIDGAGHWIQQERPAAVADVLLGMLGG
jgi:pimeloyl-ACP methyl ester carboxylesterase